MSALPTSDSPLILSQRDGDIVTVVLNRPEKLNAFTIDSWRLLGDTFLELDADDSVRCVLLRGAGEKAFSPGNDIGEFETARSNKQQAVEYGAVMRRTIEAIGGCQHPVVAQIHGICVGGGLEIASLADIRICGESSRFGVPIKNLGLVMSYSELAPLVRLVGPSVALQVLLEGNIFDAEQALRLGEPVVELVEQCLAQDPRPAYQQPTPERRYGARLWDLDVHWHYPEAGVIRVLDVQPALRRLTP